MERRYFRTFISGIAKVSIGDRKHSTGYLRSGSDMLTIPTGNREIDDFVASLSGVVEGFERKLSDIKNKMDGCEEVKNDFFNCELIDISGNGLKLLLNEGVKVDDILFINLDLFGRLFQQFEIYGRVVRVVAQPTVMGEMFYAGVEFIELEDKKREQLINFIFSQQRKYIRAFLNGGQTNAEQDKSGGSTLVG